MADRILRIEKLRVGVENKEILKGINLEVNKKEIHVIIGPNGSGKSVLSFTIMGNPKYKILEGRVIYKGEDITYLSPYKRAKRGIFLSFQTPLEIEHINMMSFLRNIYVKAKEIKKENILSVREFREYVEHIMKELHLNKNALVRGINEGLSGGEKKKSEVLQMLLLDPELIILDEIDTGLDIDSLKKVSEIIKELNQKKDKTFIIISHNQKMLHYIKPHKIHIMVEGKIVYSTSEIQDIEKIIEKEGYRKFKEEFVQ